MFTRIAKPARITFVLSLLTLAVAAAALPSQAQPPRRTTATESVAPARQDAPQAAAGAEAPDARGTQQRLNALFRQYPPSLPQVLRLDPSLLTNADYLATYPALGVFLAEHPEVAHNPSYFVGDARGGSEADDARGMALHMWRQVMQSLTVFLVMGTLIFAFIWLVRTLIEHRRWQRLSKVQTEAHTKLLDRLTSNEDLLAYIQTPAGRRFLESAPIPLDLGPRAISAPIGRILWSVQVGLVLAMGGLGLHFASGRMVPVEISQPLSVIGVLAMALGLGFILSAVAAYALARHLALLERPARPEGTDASAS